MRIHDGESNDVTWYHMTSQWYNFLDQAQGYLINLDLFRCALTERKSKGVHSSSPMVGYKLAWSSEGEHDGAKHLNSICTA